ncbi:unnamed protein product [Bemisia tabaci]|uniref:Uncharacterized protein n=1 Tax=Bemisia tabaci TaxID=7038 RepID=A0A9P0A271_BEMTA|nr:unnamed protein product [Bemisia tabaci]
MVFVQKSSRYEMPPDAIVLTPREAAKYQFENFERLNKSVTWPVLYGRKVIAISVLVQSSYLLMRFRTRYRLGNYGLLSTSLPFCAAPTLMSAAFQESFITEKVILQNECSVCLHTNSVLALAFFTHIVGGAGGAMATLYYAHNKGTYTLPPRSGSGLLKFGKDVFNLNRRFSNYHWIFLAFNILLSGTVIALQERATRQVTEILEQEDYDRVKESYLRSKQRRYNV